MGAKVGGMVGVCRNLNRRVRIMRNFGRGIDGYSAALILSRPRRVEVLEIEVAPLAKLCNVIRINSNVVRRVRNLMDLKGGIK